MPIENAIEIIKKKNSKDRLIAYAETNELFIFSFDNDSESYDTVNKKTGQIGRMWIHEYLDLIDGKLIVQNPSGKTPTERFCVQFD